MAEQGELGLQAEQTEPVVKAEIAGNTPMEVSEAAKALSNWRRKQAGAAAPAAQQEQQQERAEEAAPADQQSVEETDANPDAGHGEEQAGEAQEAPIAPPVSWTAAEKERWQSLPRETQQYIAQREGERERLLTQSQQANEEQRKQLEVELAKARQSQQQYDQALPALLQTLQSKLAGDFSDIQSMADVHRMAKDDWARYLQWDAQQKEIAAVSAEVQASQTRQAQENVQAFARFAQDQDKLFIDRAPDFKDKDKAAELQDAAILLLKDLGFTDGELSKHWTGQDFLSLRDHRVQLLLADGVRYRQAKAAQKKVAQKPLPPVARPGVAQPPTNAAEQVKAAQTRILKSSGQMNSVRAGVQLMQALRAQNAGRR